MSHVATSNASTLSASRWPIWTGRTLSGLVILFLVMDAGMKIAALPIVSESAVTIGWTADPSFWRAMGLLLLAITAALCLAANRSARRDPAHRLSGRCGGHRICA